MRGASEAITQGVNYRQTRMDSMQTKEVSQRKTKVEESPQTHQTCFHAYREIFPMVDNLFIYVFIYIFL